MPCEKCGAPSAHQYDFFLILGKDQNPFDKKERAVGRWHAEICSDCAQEHWNRKFNALLIVLGVLIAGAGIRFVVFAMSDFGILDLGGGLLTLFALFWVHGMAKQRKTKREELAALILKTGEYGRDGLSISSPGQRYINNKDLVQFDDLPEHLPGERIKAIRYLFPEADVAKTSRCDICGAEKSDGFGLQFPFVAGWIRTHTGGGYAEFTYYGFAPVSVAVCPSCLQRGPIGESLKSLKKEAIRKGGEAIAANQKADKRLLDSESVAIFTLAQFAQLQQIKSSK